MTFDISSNLKALRENAGLTQFELAIKANVNPSHISRLENGKFMARKPTIRRIAKALNVAPESLMMPAEAA